MVLLHIIDSENDIRESGLLSQRQSFNYTFLARGTFQYHCVEQCASQGLITSQGVANSLLAKLNAAQATQDQGRSSVAISDLQACIHEVQAQAGKHIDAKHAQDMLMHAQSVIQALGG